MPSFEKQATGVRLEEEWLDCDNLNWNQFTTMHPMGIELGNLSQSISPDLEMNPETMTEMGGGLEDGQWWDEATSLRTPLFKPEANDVNIATNYLHELVSQVMAVSTRALSATSALLHSNSPPPTVSSTYVNEAFEGTRTLVRIINTISMKISGERGEGLQECVEEDGIGGLVLTTLACQQHLLGLFKAICKSIENCLEMVSGKKQVSDGIHGGSLNGDGAASSAQFTMVLQLLVHLINRLDRCLFTSPHTLSSPPSASSASAYGGVEDMVYMGKEAELQAQMDKLEEL
ncbi:fungal zn(2)-Cys(6) binuclear cluster domain-containing protein [Fusarium austroafricanum]|uniref:Fungal zn(2)-Cys(6) binuclear cluster domain-containing protein n=1 Tax=Fusarium austroafricanum TaxID=2364996 RepID=A0A8H4K2M2_9HYPO|nr:fungal zn(2)-Cys(6) binuclear cluster domain-containing protein [Fusarium austroafricanum]